MFHCFSFFLFLSVCDTLKKRNGLAANSWFITPWGDQMILLSWCFLFTMQGESQLTDTSVRLTSLLLVVPMSYPMGKHFRGFGTHVKEAPKVTSWTTWTHKPWSNSKGCLCSLWTVPTGMRGGVVSVPAVSPKSHSEHSFNIPILLLLLFVAFGSNRGSTVNKKLIIQWWNGWSFYSVIKVLVLIQN